ncbi:MAG: hypothetical protein AB9907_00030 [Flexilinea sp.]
MERAFGVGVVQPVSQRRTARKWIMETRDLKIIAQMGDYFYV